MNNDKSDVKASPPNHAPADPTPTATDDAAKQESQSEPIAETCIKDQPATTEVTRKNTVSISSTKRLEHITRNEALRHVESAWIAQQRVMRRCLQLRFLQHADGEEDGEAKNEKGHENKQQIQPDSSPDKVIDLAQDSDSAERGAKKRKRAIASSSAACSSMLLGFLAVISLFLRQNNLASTDLSDFFYATNRTSSLLLMTQQQSQRRSLSFFQKDTCKSLSPKVYSSEVISQSSLTYFATYPGSAARPARSLLTSLTGLRVGNDHDMQRREYAIAIQTRYPHRSGVLYVDDNEIGRAIVMLRNPMDAVVGLFDELYQMNLHIPSTFRGGLNDQQGVTKASVAEWGNWRDRMLEGQLEQYRDFVRFWMMRYRDEDMLILSHEDLFNEATGMEEVSRLIKFMLEVEGVQTVDSKNAVCLWRNVMSGKSQNSQDEQEEHGSQRRWLKDFVGFLIPHPSSVQSDGKNERPYTPEQMKAISKMLQSLANDFQNDEHLHQILVKYNQHVTGQTNNINPSESSPTTPQSSSNRLGTTTDGRTFHIFHAASTDSNSHTITNWLMGLFDPESNFSHLVTSPELAIYQNNKLVDSLSSTVVTKTDSMDLMSVYKMFKPGFDEVFFVLSNINRRDEAKVDKELCTYGEVHSYCSLVLHW